MKTASVFKTALLLAAGTMLLSGCVYRERTVYRSPGHRTVVTSTYVAPAPTEVVVRTAPPAPVREVVVVSPGPGFVWVDGCWVWHNRWEWERGHWVRPPRPGVVWVPHRYVYRGGVHVFIAGGWR